MNKNLKFPGWELNLEKVCLIPGLGTFSLSWKTFTMIVLK